jgi:hypothetical protein
MGGKNTALREIFRLHSPFFGLGTGQVPLSIVGNGK